MSNMQFSFNRANRPTVGKAEANPFQLAMRDLRRPALIAAGFSALINILMLTGSLYMLQVYDRVLGSGSVATLQGLFLVVILAYVFYGIYEFLRARVLSRAAVRLSNRVAPEAFRAWLRSGLDGQRGAGLPLRDVEILRGFIASPVMGTLFDLPWIPFYMIVLYAVHPLLGLVTLAGVVVVVLVALASKYLTQRSIDRGMLEETASREFADHGQRNAETIAAMGMSDAVIAQWQQLQNASLATAQRTSDVTEVSSSFSKAFRMFLQSAMLTMGAWLVLGHEISAGMIIASSVISGRLLAPIDQLVAQWKQIGRASVAHARLRDFFDAQNVRTEPLGLASPTGRITATHLTRFLPQTEPGRERRRQLDRVSFSIEAGGGLGVIGDSASGKSTLARLLVGACSAEAGELRFDGATREQWGPDLGRHIGYLPQSVVMLPGSVRDNIRRFMTDRSAKEVIDAARLAGVHDMILRLPQGYDTMLGSSNEPLSGGQLQRIGLARAIFGLPPIVVLDEPNSNLDSLGEAALRDTISSLRANGTTVILITHRIGILQAMDHVLMLKQGAVVKFGQRDEVLISLGLAAPAPTPAAARNGTRPVTFLRPKMPNGATNALAKIEAEDIEEAVNSTVAPSAVAASGNIAIAAATPATPSRIPTLQLTPALAVSGKADAKVIRAVEAEPMAVFYRKTRPGPTAPTPDTVPEADRTATNLAFAASRKEG